MTRKELPALAAQLEVELQRLGEVVGEIESLVDTVREREPTRVEVVAAAAYLHNLYNAIENCLARVAHGVDESVPTGPESHRLLLDQLSAPIAALRPALLDRELAAGLDEYRRFRHAFRHTYFFDLDWERIHQLLVGAHPLGESFARAVRGLLDALKDG